MKIVTYLCADADCPPEHRAVAHCLEESFYKGRSRGFQLLPATATAPTVDEARAKLKGFLEREIAREQLRAAKANATGERIRAYWAGQRA